MTPIPEVSETFSQAAKSLSEITKKLYVSIQNVVDCSSVKTLASRRELLLWEMGALINQFLGCEQLPLTPPNIPDLNQAIGVAFGTSDVVPINYTRELNDRILFFRENCSSIRLAAIHFLGAWLEDGRATYAGMNSEYPAIPNSEF
jgi:hypothetical protein